MSVTTRTGIVLVGAGLLALPLVACGAHAQAKPDANEPVASKTPVASEGSATDPVEHSDAEEADPEEKIESTEVSEEDDASEDVDADDVKDTIAAEALARGHLVANMTLAGS